MDANYLRNLLGSATLEAIRAARNEEEGSSVSVPILGSSSVQQVQDFTSFRYQQAQQPANLMSAVEHRFSSVSTRISGAPHEGSNPPELTLMNMDLDGSSTFHTTQYSVDVSKISDSITARIRRPKRSAKSGPVVDYTSIYAQPQYSSVPPAKDDLSASISPSKNILYRQTQQEAFSVSDQLTSIEHRLPSVPMEWSSTYSIMDLKEHRRAQLKEGKIKFKTHQTEQGKKEVQMEDKERKRKFTATMNPQQRSIFQQHHAQAQAKFEKSLPQEKKERVKVQHLQAQAKFKKSLPQEKKERVKMQNLKAQAKLREAMTPEQIMQHARAQAKRVATMNPEEKQEIKCCILGQKLKGWQL